MSSPATTATSGLSQEFLDHVAKDCRGHLSKTETEKLHSPHMAQPRYDALLALKKGVESQLSHQKGRMATAYVDSQSDEEWERYRAEQIEWRGKAIRFLTTVETHMIAAKQLMRDQRSDDADAEYLRSLIRSHLEAMLDDDMEFTDADNALHIGSGVREITAQLAHGQVA